MTNAPIRAVSAGLLIAVLMTAPKAIAAEEDFRVWENITAITNLGSLDPKLDKWRWWLEGQGRFRDDAGALDQSLARTAIGYQLTDRASIWLGYAHVGNYPRPQARIQHEHRIWQQLLLTDKPSFGDLMSRTRLEQRFIQNVDPVEWRLREFVRFSRPIVEGSAFSFVVWDEVFVRLNSTTPGTRFGFDQNRAFAGIGYTFSKQARVEVGYINQLIQLRTVTRRAQGFNERMNHILSVSMFLNL
ncbi:DUF2490 domain-containing protein [Methylocystis sp. WRRC1]|uniref:DUF2490 domain-containing protein n=1 Tax=Methylocystis sp. WRRC1 TaxID=1732014 RepID=UPI001D138E81|nr:DUF2490 domain-containing protein [Methylocystis sp. WRRC1]MCC3244405.1 DUF2490 domain-containing protein [Methylocystis sp. WRRC1]